MKTKSILGGALPKRVYYDWSTCTIAHVPGEERKVHSFLLPLTVSKHLEHRRQRLRGLASRHMNLDVLTLDRPSLTLVPATIAGIAANALSVRKRAQRTVQEPPASSRGGKPKQASSRGGEAKLSTAIDASFARRLRTIMQIIVPSWRSQEAGILLLQTLTLLCRTLLSLRIARCGGEGIKAVMHKSLHGFARCLLDFSLTGIVAGVVNSALKFRAPRPIGNPR